MERWQAQPLGALRPGTMVQIDPAALQQLRYVPTQATVNAQIGTYFNTYTYWPQQLSFDSNVWAQPVPQGREATNRDPVADWYAGRFPVDPLDPVANSPNKLSAIGAHLGEDGGEAVGGGAEGGDRVG